MTWQCSASGFTSAKRSTVASKPMAVEDWAEPLDFVRAIFSVPRFPELGAGSSTAIYCASVKLSIPMGRLRITDRGRLLRFFRFCGPTATGCRLPVPE